MSRHVTTIPCHVIAGPLGVGKTTAILNFLKQHASAQRVGVLVNDFGPVGLDSATLGAEAPETAVLNVPGGCICCTMLAQLPECIRRITSEQDVDRIIIEPSGMATPEHVIDVLRHGEGELGIRVQPVIVLLDAADFDEETYGRMAYFRSFYEAADILVLNRCDRASRSRIDEALRWARELDPPKLRVITTSHGELPRTLYEWSELPERAASASSCCGGHCHTHRHDQPDLHDHDHGSAHDPTIRPGGLTLDPGRRFDQQGLLVNLMRLCEEGVGENRVLRLKGVFHTNEGWQAIEIANREVSIRPSSHRRDNRFEWLTQPGEVDGTQMLAEIDRAVDWERVAELID